MQSPHLSTGSCEHCKSSFQYRLIHNGFNDSAYAYCDECSFTVPLCVYAHAAQRVGLTLYERITKEIEAFLKPCPCGGLFLASAGPKCPNCFRPLSATKARSFIERNAAGTAKGWRWQGSWSGLYSIALNDNIVDDWWDEQKID